MRTHWSKLRPIPGYVRVPDEEFTDVRNGRPRYRRMMRCEVDGTVIPTLGRGYHETGKAHREAAARQWATEMGSSS